MVEKIHGREHEGKYPWSFSARKHRKIKPSVGLGDIGNVCKIK